MKAARELTLLSSVVNSWCGWSNAEKPRSGWLRRGHKAERTVLSFRHLHADTKPPQHASCLSNLVARVTATKQAKTTTTTLVSKRNSWQEYNLLRRDSSVFSEGKENELLRSICAWIILLVTASALLLLQIFLRNTYCKSVYKGFVNWHPQQLITVAKKGKNHCSITAVFSPKIEFTVTRSRRHCYIQKVLSNTQSSAVLRSEVEKM